MLNKAESFDQLVYLSQRQKKIIEITNGKNEVSVVFYTIKVYKNRKGNIQSDITSIAVSVRLLNVLLINL